MRRLRFTSPLGLSLLLVAASLASLWLKADALPEVVASHFDARGRANGFQSRSGFLITSLVFELGLLALFAGLPRLLHVLPTRLINLPNREYWLSPERKQQALERMTVMLDYFGLATLALIAATLELAMRANLRGGPLDNTAMWLLLGAYMAFSLVWVTRFYRAFAQPAAKP